ncbi:hypothetical protein AAF712_004451 [Marasmius tenuissimus]|uniref:Uncharacterized protein n=1 Tax=Marasmius tenuissimus TaxID=585030 RepID=A0ABR3A5V0_9AGAR
MPQPSNFGDTLSSGIQDVAALLPLLGTEQCERHVGTALEKGYLYAAATPLSIFGSLGIVKTAFSTLLATTTRPFHGGSWLDDAGFGTTGSASSMVTLVKGTQQYGAEVQLQRLMEEQHIDDPELIADIEWFGWERKKNAGDMALSLLPALSWNVALILTSLLSSLVSISPYLYLIHNSWGSATLWLFPLLRSFGALLCVVSIQFALQIRIHRITTTSLLLMKARKRSPLSTVEAIKDRDTLLEARLRYLRLELSDPEKQPESQTGILDETGAESRSQDALLLLLQVVLVVGMGMIVAGYVGCFTIVGRTDVDAGPYVWFGMEAMLALLRITLWGWNPRWDEGGTAMTMRLHLRSRDLTCGGVKSPDSLNHRSPTSSPCLDLLETSDADRDNQLASDPPLPSFPLITTARFLSQFTETSTTSFGWQRVEVSLVVENIEDFLAAATPYVGPLRRLEAEELKGISLYCGIVPNGEIKLLCITACRDDSRWSSISVLIDGNTPPHAIYDSRSQDLPGVRALRVSLQNKVQMGSVTVIDRRTLDLLIDYSSHLFSRLCIVDNFANRLPLSWTVTLPCLPSLPESQYLQQSLPLTNEDKTYIQMHQIQDLKRDYCLMRGNLLLGVLPLNQTAKDDDELTEWTLILDSAVMEVYLCILEHRFAQSLSLSPTQFRRLALEWIRGMEDRISLEKEACRERQKGLTYRMRFCYETTYDQLVQELRSLRQLPIDSASLKGWNGLIAAIIDQRGELPDVSTLFGLPPLQNLEELSRILLPFFVVNHKGTSLPTRAYSNMIAFLRSSLQRLHSAKASLISLHDPIDPWGPGSPEFSPPYTCIQELSEKASNAFFEQKESIHMIELRDASSQQTLFDALHLLNSLPSTQSLTTVMFNRVWFGTEATHLVTSVLQRHPRLLYLAFEDCSFTDRALIDNNIAMNRRKWQEEAQSVGVFTYIFGCEIRPGNYEENDPFRVYHHDILLSDLADLLAMIYIPQEGKVVLSLTLQACIEDITLVASLTPSDTAREAGGTDGTLTTQFHVLASYEFESISIEGFPLVEAGCYELRIRLARTAQYLFRKLTIDFITASDGIEPPGKPRAEGSSSVSNIGSNI